MQTSPSIIQDKTEFRRLWLDGSLGNRPRVWTSVQELKDSGYQGEMSLRIHTPGSPYTMYGVPMSDLCKAMWHLAGLGIDTEQVWFNESAPDDVLILQGEYFHGGAKGVFLNRYLMYSRARTKMKTAMALPLSPDLYIATHPSWSHDAHRQFRHQSEGLATDLLLQSVMTPYSWEEFRELRDRYPDHTIEFGVYGKNVGTNPGCNHFIWEVRRY